MNTIALDTHKIFEILQGKGFTKKQTEGLIESMREVNLSNIATKEDLSILEVKLESKITKVESRLESMIEKSKASILWMIVPLILGQYVMILGLKFF